MKGFLEELNGFFDTIDIVSPETKLFEKYTDFTAPVVNTPCCAVQPRNENQVIQLMEWAHKNKVSVRPIATGQNWGYGDSGVQSDFEIIVDFCHMNKVISFDEQLGIITLQPGITQQQLFEFLQQINSDFMVPTTGAGPSCGVVSNALERGFGLNNTRDHFQAVHALKGVMADGTLYQSPFYAMSSNADAVFKWHTGPYFDGLFAQGNTLVVTEMTLALEKKPKHKVLILLECKKEQDLPNMLHALRDIISDYGHNLSTVQISDATRVLSMLAPYPEKNEKFLDEEEVKNLSKQFNIKPWVLYFFVLGDKKTATCIAKQCAKRLKRFSAVKRLDSRFIEKAHQFLAKLPFNVCRELVMKLQGLVQASNLMSGVPSEVALPLAYWKTGKPPKTKLNPAKDGCGLVWFAPVVPLKKEKFLTAVTLVRKICRDYKIEPMITASVMNMRCMEFTVPLLYDKETQMEDVQACYKDLFEACRKEGLLPYRYPNFFMKELVNSGDSYWKHVKTLKKALDPKNIIAPNRYS